MLNDSRFAAMVECRILNYSLFIAAGDHSTFNTQHSTLLRRMKKNFWEVVIRIAIAALTAALTALGTTSCMGFGPF